jgi:hypothetical protein
VISQSKKQRQEKKQALKASALLTDPEDQAVAAIAIAKIDVEVDILLDEIEELDERLMKSSEVQIIYHKKTNQLLLFSFF